jgi:hypothetical protein
MILKAHISKSLYYWKGKREPSGTHHIKESSMQIPVLFSDNSAGQASPEILDELIRNRKIISFRRSGGWIRIGFDPVRGDGGNYNGPERRGT